MDTTVFHSGDVIRVMDDRGEVSKLQKGHGEWNDSMSMVSVEYAQLLLCSCVAMSSSNAATSYLAPLTGYNIWETMALEPCVPPPPHIVHVANKYHINTIIINCTCTYILEAVK